MRPEKYSYVLNRCNIPNKFHDSLFLYTDLIVGNDNGNIIRIFFILLSHILYNSISQKTL